MTNSNKKILIVEDDKDFLAILEKIFSSDGFQVQVAQDARECLNILQSDQPALIIADILLPGIDGIEMVKKIKGLGFSIPILFLTNVKDADYVDRIKELSEFDCLIKSEIGIADIVKKAKDKLKLS